MCPSLKMAADIPIIIVDEVRIIKMTAIHGYLSWLMPKQALPIPPTPL